MSGNLGADGSKGHGEDVVEGSDQRELGDVLVGVRILFGEGRDEGEAGEEGELSDLWVVEKSERSAPSLALILRSREEAHLVNLSGNSRREEQSLPRHLPAIRQASNNLLYFLPKSLLEEAVGLIEDQGAAGRELGLEVRVLEVVEDTTGGGDEDVAALLVEAVGLGVHVGATNDLKWARKRRGARMAEVRQGGGLASRSANVLTSDGKVEYTHVLDGVVGTAEKSTSSLLNLDGELTSRRKDEDADLAGGGLGLGAEEELDRGNAEGKSLSGSSLGLSEAVGLD